jgi:hypothetical protein
MPDTALNNLCLKISHVCYFQQKNKDENEEQIKQETTSQFVLLPTRLGVGHSGVRLLAGERYIYIYIFFFFFFANKSLPQI